MLLGSVCKSLTGAYVLRSLNLYVRVRKKAAMQASVRTWATAESVQAALPCADLSRDGGSSVDISGGSSDMLLCDLRVAGNRIATFACP